MSGADHANCNHAYQQVRCDRCGREYTCQPWDDFYCAAEGDHCCEACLLGGRPIVVEVLPGHDGEATVVFERDLPGTVPDAA